MKKITLLASAVCVAALLVTGCASNSKVESTKQTTTTTHDVPKQTKSVTREMVDWKGASIGAEIPEWVYAAVEDDYSTLGKLPQFNKKKIICAEAQGKNLDLLKSWVNNFNVQSAYSKSISNFVTSNFGGELSGSKDSTVSQTFLDEVVASFSKQEVNGLEKEMDFWVLTRITDTTKDTVQDVYSYFVVYGIDESTFNYQIAKALGLVAAEEESEKEMKTKVQSAMEEAKVYAEQENK